MLAQERRKRIGRFIRSEGSITVDQLSETFDVSPMTAWRDLRALEEIGEAVRVHGGAVRPASSDMLEPPFAGKSMLRVREKSAIARYTAENLIANDDILIVEGGTTAATVVPLILAANITLLTNGLDVLNRASEKLPALNVMCCGGILRESSLTFVGPQAEAFFTNLMADKLIVSAAAFSTTDGLMDPNPLEIQIKQAMARCARQRIALVDSSKFSLRSLAVSLTPAVIDILVTDENVPADAVDQLLEQSIDVRIAKFTD